VSRQVYLKSDITYPTVKVDLAPQLQGMPLSYSQLEVFRGDDTSINFTISQNGVAFNLTGYTVKYQAKQAIGDDSFVFDKTATVTNAAAGQCRVDLTGSDLGDAGEYTAQLALTINGTTNTVFQSPIVVLPSV
jgi:hypothetical protein